MLIFVGKIQPRINEMNNAITAILFEGKNDLVDDVRLDRAELRQQRWTQHGGGGGAAVPCSTVNTQFAWPLFPWYHVIIRVSFFLFLFIIYLCCRCRESTIQPSDGRHQRQGYYFYGDTKWSIIYCFFVLYTLTTTADKEDALFVFRPTHTSEVSSG